VCGVKAMQGLPNNAKIGKLYIRINSVLPANTNFKLDLRDLIDFGPGPTQVQKLTIGEIIIVDLAGMHAIPLNLMLGTAEADINIQLGAVYTNAGFKPTIRHFLSGLADRLPVVTDANYSKLALGYGLSSFGLYVPKEVEITNFIGDANSVPKVVTFFPKIWNVEATGLLVNGIGTADLAEAIATDIENIITDPAAPYALTVADMNLL